MRRLFLLALLFAACRPDPGVPDYSGMAGLLDAGDTSGNLPGPRPYVPGTKRLAFGIFYEGGASDLLAIDDATRHYYVFESTYSQESSSDRLEGLHSDELTFTGSAWWGGGLVWDTPVDLSAWKTMYASFESPDPHLDALDLRMLSGAGASPTSIALPASRYGWNNDGTWHSLAVPLADFADAGVDLTKVRGPFVLGGVNAGSGETLLVDDVYFE